MEKEETNQFHDKSILDNLTPSEAQTLLGCFLKTHPNFACELEQMAKSLLSKISFSAIAEELESDLLSFDIDDLNSRAGSHSWGYVDPSEAADETLNEVLKPFIEDMKRHLDLGLENEALEICKGILLGLYSIRDTENEFLGWAPDFPEDGADSTLSVWCKEKTTLKFPQDFVDNFIPAWHSLVTNFISPLAI